MTGLRSRLSEAAGKFWEVLRGTGKDGRDGEGSGRTREDGRTEAARRPSDGRRSRQAGRPSEDGRTGEDDVDYWLSVFKDAGRTDRIDLVKTIGERDDIVAASGFFLGKDKMIRYFEKNEAVSYAAWHKTFCNADAYAVTKMIITALVAAMVTDDRLFVEFDELYEGFLRDRRKLKEI